MTLPLINVLKIIVATSIFFVWVIRYDNIIKEFKEYSLPNELRDLVGILKLSFAFMLMSSNQSLVVFGAGGIALLMLGAQVTHLRVKSCFKKMLPSLCLLIISFFIIYKHIA